MVKGEVGYWSEGVVVSRRAAEESGSTTGLGLMWLFFC